MMFSEYHFSKWSKLIYIILCCSSLITLFLLLNNIEVVKIDVYHFLAVKQVSGDNLSKENDLQIERILSKSDDDDSVACKIPTLNPWDPLIMKGVKHPKDLHCDQVQPFLTYIDDDGYLRINETEQKLFHERNQSFSCSYWTFDKSQERTDSRLSFDAKINLTNPVRLNKHYVKVECNSKGDESDESQLYWNYHAHPSELKNKSRFAKPTEDQLSVFMFILDSVSYSAMQRNLPLTLNYTSNVMGMKYFKALNKVGDNSFPNFMAMLMGKRVIDEQDDMPREMRGDYSKIKYDSWPFIWKLFSSKGYATVFNEDNPQVGLFHFDAKGFAEKPVDFYHHTFWVAVQAESNHDYICFLNSVKARMMLDLTRRQIISMRNHLYFMLTSTMELSHDKDNQVELLDDDLVKLWQTLYEGNHLNHSVVIFASDHGIRHDWIRTTQIGLLEERLPFYALWFPKWYLDKHPHIKKNVENNLNILSSSYDVYETLLDILNANWYNNSQRNETQRGQSQLYPLPKTRTCKGAGIPDHYCTCSKESPLDSNDTLVQEGASYLVQQLNFMLSNFSDICRTIELKNILFAKQVIINEKVKQGIRSKEELKLFHSGINVKNTGNFTKEIRIGIETHPHNALFDALLRKQIVGHVRTWTVIGTISRSSTYKGLSDCLQDKLLRKYCSCKDISGA